MSNFLKNILLTLGVLALSACQHQNPLKTNSKRDTLTFLMNASANTEKRLHFPIQKDSFGYAYLECMDGKTSPEINCNALYLGMVAFAKERHYLGFEQLSSSDLTDHRLFLKLADDYAEFAATHEPHFVSTRSS